MMPSPTVENYLKQILMISLERHKREVPMGLISESLKVTPGTATSMVKNLEKEGWLIYKSRKGVKLTASGRKLGMNILRRHRLLETFLVETLGLDWSEIHDEAEELEPRPAVLEAEKLEPRPAVLKAKETAAAAERPAAVRLLLQNAQVQMTLTIESV